VSKSGHLPGRLKDVDGISLLLKPMPMAENMGTHHQLTHRLMATGFYIDSASKLDRSMAMQ
jgi:hypothetical protein